MTDPTEGLDEPLLGTPPPARMPLRKISPSHDFVSFVVSLGLDDFAAAQAGRTHAHAFGGRAHFGVNRPQIDIPAPLAHIMRVADGVAAHRLFAANLTNLCHSTALQNRSELVVQTIDYTGFEGILATIAMDRDDIPAGHEKATFPMNRTI